MLLEKLDSGFRDYIASIKTEQYFLSDRKKIIPELAKRIENAVLKRIGGREIIGIAFSGGVDSTLIAMIAAKHKKRFKLFAAGFENSSDVVCAKKIADYYGWPLETKIVSMEDAEETVKRVACMLDTDDVVSVGVGCVVYSALELAKLHKINTVLSGSGPEELFAGYKRHQIICEDAKKTHDECWRGLECLYYKDIERDAKLAECLGVELLVPFMDDELIRYAMQIDPRLKASKDEKKIILREAAVSLGLKREFAYRKKKAAQYGSYFDKALMKLAKSNGFKHRKEYLRFLLGSR